MSLKCDDMKPPRFHILKSCRWLEVYTPWGDNGAFARVMVGLSGDGVVQIAMIDTAQLRSPRTVPGMAVKKGGADQGRCASCDSQRCPRNIFVTAGQLGDAIGEPSVGGEWSPWGHGSDADLFGSL